MTRFVLLSATLLTCAALSFGANPQSPAAETSVNIGGKLITIKYSAPSLRGRKMFGPDGRISKDPTWPVWRAGADDATALHTEGTLVFDDLLVPPGDYTIFALVNVMPFKLIISKATKEWGLSYEPGKDLGRVPMTMTKPQAPIETFVIKLSKDGSNRGNLQLEWENVIASVYFTVR